LFVLIVLLSVVLAVCCHPFLPVIASAAMEKTNSIQIWTQTNTNETTQK
jgi:hypothetical protein